MKQRILAIAKSKVRNFYGDRALYCGHLTPSEFLALVEAGIKANKNDVVRATKWKTEGDSNPSWYYFNLGKVNLLQK